MTNRDVFRAFVRRTEARANNLHSVRYGEMTVLYSYNTPIAYIHDESPDLLRIDDRRYSVTTSKQRSQCIGEFHRTISDPVSCEVPHVEFRARLKKMHADLSYAR